MRKSMDDVRESKDTVYTMIDESLVEDLVETLRGYDLDVEVR
jgi:hypothetical protein